MSLWLARDQRSNEVVALQNALNVRLKPVEPLRLDGIFGPLTEAALRDFQKCETLKADGIAGPHTLGRLFVRRTVVSRFVLTVGATAGRDGAGAAAPTVDPIVGSPYDIPRLPYPRTPSFEERLSAWLRDRPPKRACPATPPDDGGAKQTPAVPSPAGPRRGPRRSLSRSRPTAHGWMSANQWVEFEYATDIGKELGHEVEIVQSFTAAFVRAAPYIMPSASFVLAPGGGSGVQASVQYFDTDIVDWEWKNMVGEPDSVGTLRIAPLLVTSVMWELGQKYPKLDVFGGLRLEAKWKKEWHGRRGRAHEIGLFAGLAVGAVIAGEKEGEGRFRTNAFGAEGKFQLGFRYGIAPRPPRRRH